MPEPKLINVLTYFKYVYVLMHKHDEKKNIRQLYQTQDDLLNVIKDIPL